MLSLFRVEGVTVSASIYYENGYVHSPIPAICNLMLWHFSQSAQDIICKLQRMLHNTFSSSVTLIYYLNYVHYLPTKKYLFHSDVICAWQHNFDTWAYVPTIFVLLSNVYLQDAKWHQHHEYSTVESATSHGRERRDASNMTSSNGNIIRVTGPLCGEFNGRRWIPLTKASGA